MKPTTSTISRTSQSAASRPVVLATVCFLLGAALAGAWFYHQSSRATSGTLPAEARALLSQLNHPVNLRFYSLLPAGSANAELQAFSGRVAQLLAAMQETSGGKITVTSIETDSPANANAAAADGLQAFNLDKGDACYLGLLVSSEKKKEALARLQPEWEAALPYDLARVILRIAAASASSPLPPEVAKPSPEILQSVKTLIPDPANVTVEQADQIFHAEFLKECALLNTQVEADLTAAQKQVEQAQAGGSTSELEAAQKNLQKVQLEAGEKMKQIAANLQTRLAVYKQMKADSSH